MSLAASSPLTFSSSGSVRASVAGRSVLDSAASAGAGISDIAHIADRLNAKNFLGVGFYIFRHSLLLG